MRPPRYAYLVEKAVDACLAAIEIYNKPNFEYREETFSILMLNAWELLLKARILKENNNRMREIEVWIPKRKKDGSATKRIYPKKNRSGSTMTIGLGTAANTVQEYDDDGIDNLCVANLILLTEIRDNAVHLHNKSKGLQKRIHEIGSASLRNFARSAKDWFGMDLSAYNFFLMPLAFESPTGVLEAAFADIGTGATAKLAQLLLDHQDRYPFDPEKPFNVGIEIQMRFVRKPTPEAMPVEMGKGNPKAVPIVISEEDALKAFP